MESSNVSSNGVTDYANLPCLNACLMSNFCLIIDYLGLALQETENSSEIGNYYTT